MARANKDVGEEVTSLANLAWVHYRIGFIAEAAREYSQLLPLIERDRQPALYAAILNNYGFCLIALGDFDRALELHTDALQMYVAQDRPARSRLCSSPRSVGLYFRTGDLQRSLETLRSAIAVQERIGDTAREAPALRVAGNAASAIRVNTTSRSNTCASPCRSTANPQNVARSRVLIASELRALGDLRGAEDELRQGARISESAVARRSAGRARPAETRHRRIMPPRSPTFAPPTSNTSRSELEFNRIDTNTALSQALLASNDVARRHRRRRRSRVDRQPHPPQIRQSGMARALSVGALSTIRSRALPRSLPLRRRSTKEQVLACIPDCRKRPRPFACRSARRPADADGAEISIRKATRCARQLTLQQLRLETLMQGADTNDSGHRKLRRTIVETRTKIDAHQVQQKSVVAGDSLLTESLRDVQSRLPDDTAVLAYFVGDQGSHAWILTRMECGTGSFQLAADCRS